MPGELEGARRSRVPPGALGVRGQGCDPPGQQRRGLRDPELVGRHDVGAPAVRCGGGRPGVLGDAEVVEHHLRSQPARRHRHRGAAVGPELVALGERQPVHGGLGEVEEHRGAEVLGVVLPRAVGDLDDETAGVPDEQAERAAAGDEVGEVPGLEQPHPAVEFVLPQRGVELDVGLSPDVVDEDVEAPVHVLDPVEERGHLCDVPVVDDRGMRGAPGGADELRRLLDGLLPVVVG